MTESVANSGAKPAAAAPARRSLWDSYAVGAAVSAFVITRIYLYGFMIAGVSDVTVYFPYAVAGVDGGLLPYRDIKIEYPPVAYWTVCLPRALSDWRLPPEEVDEETYDLHLNHYDWGFRALMLGSDVIAFALFGLMFVRRHPGLAAWGLWTYIVATSLLGYLLYDRLDIGLTMLFIVWGYCWLRADASTGSTDAGRSPESPTAGAWLWSAAGYAALGIGVGYKLIPLIAVPFALLVDVFHIWRRPREWPFLIGPAILLITALGPFIYYYALVGKDLGRMFAYHADRGLQIESLYATLLMVSQPWSELVCYYDYGSWNLRGRWEPVLLKASTWLLLAVLALLGLRSAAAALRGERYDRAAAVRMGFVAVAVATFLAKVLSPQYLIWSVPLLLWGSAEFLSPRGFKIAAVGCVVMAACTSFLFPCHYLDTMVVPPYTWGKPPDVPRFLPLWSLVHAGEDPLVASALSPHWLPPTVLITRNLMMGLLTAAVVVAALRRPGSTGRSA